MGFWIALKIVGTLCLLVTLPTMPAALPPVGPITSAATRHVGPGTRPIASISGSGLRALASSAASRHYA
jgi:hypothetical protein